MVDAKIERQHTANTDPLMAIALRRMAVRNLCAIVVVESSESSRQLVVGLQTMSQVEGEEIEIITAPSEDAALEIVGSSGSVAVVPSLISTEALKKAQCARLVNELDLDVDSDDPESKVCLVASLENVCKEATSASHLGSS